MAEKEVSEAEKAVLGGIIQNKDMYFKVIGKINADDFAEPAHQVIFKDLAELRNSAEGFSDVTSFIEFLKTKKDISKVGGQQYIMSLVSYQPLTDEIDYYVNIIRDKSLARRLFDTMHGIETDYNNKSISDISEFIGESEKRIIDVTSQRRVSDFRTSKEVIKSLFSKLNEDMLLREKLHITDPYMTGYPTGYSDLDRLTGGFHPSDLMILAARPSVGKTALSLNFAQRMAKTGRPVGIFSLEMSAEQIILRLLAAESKLPINKIKSMDFSNLEPQFGDKNSAEFQLNAAIGTLNNEDLLIDDTSAQKLVDIVSKARKLKAKCPELGLIVIDYLGLITSPSRSNAGNRQQEVSEITRGLKALARDLNVPVMVLAQLSRGIEARRTHRPVLSDLRDSGSIEQDADMVFFIYRADYYPEDDDAGEDNHPGAYHKHEEKENHETSSNSNSNISATTLILAKNRNGPIGDVNLQFFKDNCRFEASTNTSFVGEEDQ